MLLPAALFWGGKSQFLTKVLILPPTVLGAKHSVQMLYFQTHRLTIFPRWLRVDRCGFSSNCSKLRLVIHTHVVAESNQNASWSIG